MVDNNFPLLNETVFFSFQLDSQSVSSYKTTAGEASDLNNQVAGGDDSSLRSLPLVAIHQGQASTQVRSLYSKLLSILFSLESSEQPKSNVFIHSKKFVSCVSEAQN